MLIGAHVSTSGGLAKAVSWGRDRLPLDPDLQPESAAGSRPNTPEEDFAEFREAMA